VDVEKQQPAVSVYPNPATDGNINLQMNNMPRGNYSLRLLDNTGKTVYTSAMKNNGGNTLYSITPGSALANGNYELQITGGNKKINAVKLAIRKE
jgi:hypothetical protein